MSAAMGIWQRGTTSSRERWSVANRHYFNRNFRHCSLSTNK
jgi:hypothetical protein